MAADKSTAALIVGTRLFRRLSAAEIGSLAQSPRVKLKKGEELFSAGSEASAVYIVLSGEVSLEITDAEGRSISVASHGAGGVFGELAVLDGLSRSVGARAASEAELLSISSARFLALVRGNPDFALDIIRDLAAKVRRTNDTVSGLTFLNLKARVAGLLAELSATNGDARSGIAITQADLAARLGASREKVNAHLQTIQDEGAIRLGRGRIFIVDRDALLEIGADGAA
jgi:CRP-like cAMP-binding protein